MHTYLCYYTHGRHEYKLQLAANTAQEAVERAARQLHTTPHAIEAVKLDWYVAGSTYLAASTTKNVKGV
jgi:hypothetical protein